MSFYHSNCFHQLPQLLINTTLGCCSSHNSVQHFKMKIKPMCVKHEGRVQRDPPFNDGGLDAYK